MRTEPITDDDRSLIAEAEAVLEKFHVSGRHRCSAAVCTTGGNIYTGINLITGGQSDVHSEPIALGRAVMAGEPDIETSVAIIYENDDASNPMRVVSACGVCREMYHTFAPDVDVIIPGSDEPAKASLSELLPAKG